MQSYTLDVLGTEVSFKAEADPDRLEEARAMLEERYVILKEHGKHLSKEKLLTFMALALADDLILARMELQETAVIIEKLLKEIEAD